MPKQKCGLSFSCALMMQQPGLEPRDCPNYRACGSEIALTSDEQLELIRVREQSAQELQRSWEERQERVRVSRHQAATLMLRMRGCPQTLQSLGVTDPLDEIAAQLEDLRSRLSTIEREDQYIAPEGCEAHRYNVKRGRKIFWYNKLTANSACFEPVERQDRVRTIHLSHDDDPRNLEGRLGVDRRNKLTQVRTQLQVAAAAIAEALVLLADEPEMETLAEVEFVLANNQENQLEQNSLSAEPFTDDAPLPEIFNA